MHGFVKQVNISRGGVPKTPLSGAMLTPTGLVGDHQAHPQFHGGPRQAVLLISSENIDALAAAGWGVFYGALGENITTSGIDFRQVRIGQRFRIGEAILEITKVRQPCQQLNPYGKGIQKAIFDERVKANDASSPLWGLSGFYAAVERTGGIHTGDPIELLDAAV